MDRNNWTWIWRHVCNYPHIMYRDRVEVGTGQGSNKIENKAGSELA